MVLEVMNEYDFMVINTVPEPSNISPRHTCYHMWELPVLHYHDIMVIFPYPFLVVITKLLS